MTPVFRRFLGDMAVGAVVLATVAGLLLAAYYALRGG